MGTNYYQRTDICESCGRYKEKHIGKSSVGWQFCFRGYDGEEQPLISSFEDWKKELEVDGKIFDEYGRELTFKEFIELVESMKTALSNHYDHCMKEAKNRSYDMSRNWKDNEGFSFMGYEFS